MPSRRTVVALFALLTLLVVPAVAPAASSAPPETLCSVCDGIDAVAEENGASIESGESTLAIQVAENGSSRWTARIALREGADELRDDASLQHALVTETSERHVVDERRDLTTSVENDTFVVSYRGPDVGYRSTGVFVFDLLTREPNRAGVTAGADRVVLRAPPNSSVATAPRDATTWNASAVVWGDTGGDGREARVEQSYVTFAPDGTVLAGVRGRAAVALATGPSYLFGLATAASLPILMLVVTGLALSRQSESSPELTGRSPTRPLLALAVAAFGVAAVAMYASRGVPDAWLLVATLVVPTALFFGLGYVDEPRQRRGLVAVLALLPVLATFALGSAGFGALFLLVVLTAMALALGLPAFYVGRATTA